MAHVAGVNIPTGKRVVIALTYIHGIGPYSSKKICEKLFVFNILMDRALDYESRGREFESSRARHFPSPKVLGPWLK